MLVSGCASRPEYVLRSSEARKNILEYSRTECEEERTKPRLSYRHTFEQAMAGDFGALHTVFTRSEYHSGDNEAWFSIPWELLAVIGDKRFAAFILREPAYDRRCLLQYIVPGLSYPNSMNPEVVRQLMAYFTTTYPQTFALYSRYWSEPLKQAMQRTAGPSSVPLSMTSAFQQ